MTHFVAREVGAIMEWRGHKMPES